MRIVVATDRSDANAAPIVPPEASSGMTPTGIFVAGALTTT
ncbi:hypothetical protein [Halorubrum sp. GN11_10-6_MGM]|nr:hypothetical protein [Halorubrum sp. GN11_10-6_MGM]